MKRYQLTISLKDGNEIRARVSARNKADALRRLIATTGKLHIVTCDIEPIPIEPIDNNRFALTTAANKPGWYIVADLDNKVKIEFKKGRYNETQRILPIGDELPDLPAVDFATVLREIGAYLAENFKELV